ncbi:MAG: putative nucleotidyltransferase [Bacteroidia bacterium]|jgi:predicted nucleotidyltransferase
MERIATIIDNVNLHRLAKINSFAKKMYEANISNERKIFMDISNSEVQRFLQSLYDNKVEYMLVGGVATVFHGHVRTTQDLDLWVKESPENKKRLVRALKQVSVIGAENYEKVEMVPDWSSVTIGDHGFVADLMGYLKSFKKEDFDACYKRAVKAKFDSIPITVIQLKDLIAEKKATGRAKDIDDVLNLEKVQKAKGKNKGMTM